MVVMALSVINVPSQRAQDTGSIDIRSNVESIIKDPEFLANTTDAAPLLTGESLENLIEDVKSREQLIRKEIQDARTLMERAVAAQRKARAATYPFYLGIAAVVGLLVFFLLNTASKWPWDLAAWWPVWIFIALPAYLVLSGLLRTARAIPRERAKLEQAAADASTKYAARVRAAVERLLRVVLNERAADAVNGARLLTEEAPNARRDGCVQYAYSVSNIRHTPHIHH